MSTDRPFLAVSLQRAGYTTGGFHSNPFLSESFNYDTGFEVFEDYQNPLMALATRIFPRGIEVNTPVLRKLDEHLQFTTALRKAYEIVSGKSRPYVSGEVITEDVIDFLDATEEPFFVWGHYMDVHHPCFPPDRYRQQFGVEASVEVDDVAALYADFVRHPERLDDGDLDTLERLYDAAIAYVDDQLQRVLDHLEAGGRLENTVVVITSDHGELFGEHSQYAKPPRMYDELLQIPLVGSNLPPELRRASTDLVSLVDLPSIIHYALGVDSVPDRIGRIPGIDDPRNHVLAEHVVEGDAVVGVRSDEWLVELDNVRGERRLRRLEDDEEFDLETINSIGGGIEGAQKLVQRASERLSAVDAPAPADLDLELDPDVEHRLQDLGYIE